MSSFPLAKPIVLTTLVNGKVVASSKVVPTEEKPDHGGKEVMRQQHSLVVMSEEEGNCEMRRRAEHERRVEEGALQEA